ncbi:MAG: biopolymer transporter ExbD [Bdellovibrionales bacterium]|nr:biopolymer transporter ExbD [Bdellovibrionales bacterium]
MFSRKKNKSSHDQTEVNLVPFIDLLSVCISFLLFTAVWLQAGVMSSKQGLGTEAQSKEENPKSMWVELEHKDSVLVSTHGLKVNDNRRKMTLSDLLIYAESKREENPELRTALVFPSTHSNYEELIQTMNLLKKAKIVDIGISPL